MESPGSIGRAGVAEVLCVAEVSVTEAGLGVPVVDTSVEYDPLGDPGHTPATGLLQTTVVSEDLLIDIQVG